MYKVCIMKVDALVGHTRGFVKLWRFPFDENFPDILVDKTRILSSNHISLSNNFTIMCSLRYDSQVQTQRRIKCMQTNHKKAHNKRIYLSLIPVINHGYHLNSQVGENEGYGAQTVMMENERGRGSTVYYANFYQQSTNLAQ